MGNISEPGGGLFRVHDERRAGLSRTAYRLATAGLAAASGGPSEQHDHGASCAREPRLAYAAVLDAVGRAVSERVGRHWRDRHGVTHAARDLRRPATRAGSQIRSAERRTTRAGRGYRGGLHRALEPIQHRWTHRLGIVLGLPRTQGDLFCVLHPRHAVVRRRAERWRSGRGRALRRAVLHHPHHVRRWLCDHPGLSRRSVRHADGRCDSRPFAHGLVGGRHSRPGAGQLHQRRADQIRRRQERRL